MTATADRDPHSDSVALALCGAELLRRLGPGQVSEHVALAPRCTYRVGGSVRWFVTLADTVSLGTLAACVAEHGVANRVVVVGNGSNLLVADGEHEIIAVSLGEMFGDIAATADGLVVGGAALLPVVARRSVALGWAGFEWAVGVPGSIGGAVRMNAGGHGSDMASVVSGAQIIDLCSGNDRWLDVDELAFGYRTSAIAVGQVVASARLRLSPTSDAAAGDALLSEIVAWRRQHQPGGQNAGSVFANPGVDSAGRLIESCGLKGARIGSAEVSGKHANFVIADRGGSANDVASLIAHVRREVWRRSGVRLDPENKFVGFDSETLRALCGPLIEDLSAELPEREGGEK